jgi:hypothetical protein
MLIAVSTCFARVDAPDYCTGLTGLPRDLGIGHFPEATPIQKVSLQLLVVGSLLFDASDASGTLQAGRLLQDGYIDRLSDDQWVQEVVGWEKFVWASLQSVVSDYAIGFAAREPSVEKYIKTDLTLGERQLCQSQRLRKSGGFMLETSNAPMLPSY